MSQQTEEIVIPERSPAVPTAASDALSQASSSKEDQPNPPFSAAGTTLGAVTDRKKKNIRYFNSIDGMRLLASAGIVLFHLEQVGGMYDLRGQPEWLFQLIRGPAFHASLFFILGGFIYGSKFLPNIATFSLAPFLSKRFKALYPLHALTTVAMIALLVTQAAQTIDPLTLLLSAGMHLSGLWALFPIGTYSLNTPSWALSAFFLCYALLGPMLRFVNRLTTFPLLAAGFVAVLIPIGLWSGLYGIFDATAALDKDKLYLFFHIFPPYRLFEFLLGMIAAKLLLIHNPRTGVKPHPSSALFNDAVIVLALLCIFFNVRSMDRENHALWFFQYHFVMVLPYMALLFCIARGSGVIAWLLATPPVRSLGSCSFYPYLLHIPFFSWICFILEQGFGYFRLLHSPLNVLCLMGLLYAGSALVWNHKKRRKAPAGARAGNDRLRGTSSVLS